MTAAKKSLQQKGKIMSESFENHPHLSPDSDDLSAFQQRAESMKKDGEAFLETAKRLSERGVKDAEKIIELAKENWKAILAASALIGGGVALSRSKAGGKLAASIKKAMDGVKPEIKKSGSVEKIAKNSKDSKKANETAAAAAKSKTSARPKSLSH